MRRLGIGAVLDEYIINLYLPYFRCWDDVTICCGRWWAAGRSGLDVARCRWSALERLPETACHPGRSPSRRPRCCRPRWMIVQRQDCPAGRNLRYEQISARGLCRRSDFSVWRLRWWPVDSSGIVYCLIYYADTPGALNKCLSGYRLSLALAGGDELMPKLLKWQVAIYR